MSPAPLENQNLLVDADDTLWENHAHFLSALERFLALMEVRGHSRDQVKGALDAIELHRTEVNGYGSARFAGSMVATVERLEDRVAEVVRQELIDLGRWICEHPIAPFPGVATTLDALRERHRLVLVTKGQQDEQGGKIQRSGLAPLFEAVEILPEKNADTLGDVVRRRELDPRRTWMIGNSPRSDMNPAAAAGLRTVFIPHRTLWELEAAPLTVPPDLVLRRFSELREYF